MNHNDRVRMGFLFSPDPETGKFDGLQTDTLYQDVIDFKPVFTGSDIWTKTRPWADGDLDSTDLTKDQANDWNITGEKSSLVCPQAALGDFRCTIKAHFNRKFTTEDAEDYQLEHGVYLGYEVIGFYQIY